jgi:hypothetical protein
LAAFYISRAEDAIGVEHREGAGEGGLESSRASLHKQETGAIVGNPLESRHFRIGMIPFSIHDQEGFS